MGTEDPISRDPVGSFYFKCSNLKDDTTTMRTPSRNGVESEGVKCSKCPFDSSSMINQFLENCEK